MVSLGGSGGADTGYVCGLPSWRHLPPFSFLLLPVLDLSPSPLAFLSPSRAGKQLRSKTVKGL